MQECIINNLSYKEMSNMMISRQKDIYGFWLKNTQRTPARFFAEHTSKKNMS